MCKIELKPMIEEDVKQYRNWSLHTDELFLDYNFLPQTDEEVKEWVEWKTHDPFATYYTIFLDHRPIGYIGMKRINILFRSAYLGIVLDPAMVNQGYGQKALEAFLHLFFVEKRMKKLLLRVAPYNKRAFALYRKMGFQVKGTFPFIYPNGKPPFDREELKDIWDTTIECVGHFIMRGIRMELDEKEYKGGGL